MKVLSFSDLNAGDIFLFRGDYGDGETFIKAMKVKSNNPEEENDPYASNMVWLDTDRGLMDYASDAMLCYNAIDFDMVPFAELSRGDEFYYDVGGVLIIMMKCKVGYDVYAVCIDETFTQLNNKGGYKGVLKTIHDEDFVMVEKRAEVESDA